MADVIPCFGEILQENLRRTDIIFQSRQNRFFLLLPEMDQKDMDIIESRILAKWEESGYGGSVTIRCVAETIDFSETN